MHLDHYYAIIIIGYQSGKIIPFGMDEPENVYRIVTDQAQ